MNEIIAQLGNYKTLLTPSSLIPVWVQLPIYFQPSLPLAFIASDLSYLSCWKREQQRDRNVAFKLGA